jgi:hypothetical protein
LYLADGKIGPYSINDKREHPTINRRNNLREKQRDNSQPSMACGARMVSGHRVHASPKTKLQLTLSMAPSLLIRGEGLSDRRSSIDCGEATVSRFVALTLDHERP